MLKNPTPLHISAFSSLFTTVIVGLLMVVLSLAGLLTVHWSLILAICAVTYFVSYSTIIYFLKRYIYRKIKLIYKTIHLHKLTPEEKNQVVDINVDIIEEVEKEVKQWAEAQNMQIRKLKTWQEYRRRFLGDISHELKTPIFNIQGYLETLLDGGLEDQKINLLYLQRAAKNVERLNTIIEDLESISRLESGKLMLDIAAFDIRELTQEVFEDLEIKAAENNIELLFKPGASAHFQVLADRENIRQVMMNLVTNSIKYGNRNGSTKVGFYDMDKYILVEIADNGIGIPAKHLPHVFDRFYRVDKSRSREQGGSGLGLSIVKHIMEAHKQTINVRSSEKLGSTFGFTLQKA